MLSFTFPSLKETVVTVIMGSCNFEVKERVPLMRAMSWDLNSMSFWDFFLSKKVFLRQLDTLMGGLFKKKNCLHSFGSKYHKTRFFRLVENFFLSKLFDKELFWVGTKPHRRWAKIFRVDASSLFKIFKIEQVP